MTSIQSELFLKNVNRWAHYCPKEAHRLLNTSSQEISFCNTGERGEQNLSRELNGRHVYYHSPTGAAAEAHDWFSTLQLYKVKTLFIYGVGLGYGYQAVRSWLEEDSGRYLIFLEDDLEVIHKLFETDLGMQLLHGERTRLYWIPRGKNGSISEEGFQTLPEGYFISNIAFAASPLYQQEYPDQALECQNYLDFTKEIKIGHQLEQITFGEEFFHNFYRNMLDLPRSHFGDKLFGQFKGIPAIICGAGPSLEKQLPRIAALKDKAIILAGGSAINTLNAADCQPHFGVTIDPNISQYGRLFMNQAFEVPFFYRNRVFPEALIATHGEHLYVSGSEGYGIGAWFEEKLGIQGKDVLEGNNVVCFSVSIAEAMGCNPIILVGVDLAYTQQHSYAPGIIPHPILDAGYLPVTRGSNEQLLEKKDIYGDPVLTLWKWVTSAVLLTQFAIAHPKIRLINGTEGGIGVEGVQNLSLEEIEKTLLKSSLDLSSLIHLKIQNSAFSQEISKEKIHEVLEELVASLKVAKGYCASLKEEFSTLLSSLEVEGGVVTQNLIPEGALQNLKKLNQESAYQAILGRFNESFLSFYGKEDLEELYKDQTIKIDQVEIQRRRTRLNKRRYAFLKAVCNTNMEHIRRAKEDQRIRHIIETALKQEDRVQGQTITAQEVLERMRQQTSYALEGETFHIIDSDLDLLIKDKVHLVPIFKTSNQFELADVPSTGSWEFYDEKGFLTLKQHYRDGKLHGPSYVYSSSGEVLANAWYVEGKKEGKTCAYFSSGALCSVQQYKNGLKEKRQLYFYPDGRLKSVLEYRKGQLHGVVELYFANGILKRRLHFKEGKRHGQEIVWNIGGIKESEMEYREDLPIGAARTWHVNGQLAREIIYDAVSEPCSIRAWTAEGILLPSEVLMREDYFDKVTKQTSVLTQSIEGIYSQIETLSEVVKGNDKEQDFNKDFDELKEEMARMGCFYKQMLEMTKEASSTTKEAVWKNPQTKKLLGKQVQEAADKMVGDIESIEELLKLAEDLYKSKGQENEK